MTSDEKNKALFTSLAMMLHSAAMVQLGKLKNPTTDKVERNLEQAQVSIDLLDMLLAKTKGNLAEDESTFLRQLVQELKLNYVDEIAKEQTAVKP